MCVCVHVGGYACVCVFPVCIVKHFLSLTLSPIHSLSNQLSRSLFLLIPLSSSPCLSPMTPLTGSILSRPQSTQRECIRLYQGLKAISKFYDVSLQDFLSFYQFFNRFRLGIEHSENNYCYNSEAEEGIIQFLNSLYPVLQCLVFMDITFIFCGLERCPKFSCDLGQRSMVDTSGRLT